MKTISIAAAILLAGTTVASATDLTRNGSASIKDAPGTAVSWEGSYIGGQVGYADFGGEGVIGGVHAGYDFQRGIIVFGPYASVNWSGAEIKAPNGVVDKGIDWSIGGRAGVLVSPRILAYGKVGFTQVEYNFSGGTDVLNGAEFGGGAEYNVAPGLFVGAEYLRRELHDGDVNENIGLATVKYKIGR
jgi:outer membrane immunogenic protein